MKIKVNLAQQKFGFLLHRFITITFFTFFSRFLANFIFYSNCKAANYEPRAVFGEWVIFKIVDRKRNNMLCYAMSIPKNRYDNFNKRGESFFIVTKYQNSDIYEIFLSFGQNSKKKIKTAEINIEKRKFPLMTMHDKGWAYNYFDDASILEELSRSTIFSILVEFDGGKKLIDIYSLDGFNEAMREVTAMCPGDDGGRAKK